MVVFEDCIFKDAELLISTSVTDLMKINKQFNSEIKACIGRFFIQDWGDMSPHACHANDLLLKHRLEPLMGLYSTSKGRVAIVVSNCSQGRYKLIQVALYSEVFHLYVTCK